MTKPRYRFAGRRGADYLFVRRDFCTTPPYYVLIPIASFWRVS